MLVWEIIFLSFALASDAATVALSDALCYTKMRVRYRFLIPLSFAFFQGFMPLVGYLLLRNINFGRYGKILSFAIFLFLGCNMLYNSIFSKQNKDYCCYPFTIGILLLQSVVTSIDAFTIGISFATNKINPLPIVFVIAIITFIVCLIAIKIGNIVRNTFSKRTSLFGAVFLLVLSIKSLF